MEILCTVDGENLSRFLDGELPPSDRLKVEEHVPNCPSCQLRLTEFRLADGLMASVRAAKPERGGMVASVAVAAALVASLATNVLLARSGPEAPPPTLGLPAAPSETLTSFYERVAP